MGRSHRADWFSRARWGIFVHYLAAPASSSGGADVTAEEWNRRVDSFDVARFARTAAEIGAGYVCLTLGQNSGHYCTPNATYDEIVGISPSKCARRDLVAELAAALDAHGIPLMTYLPSGPPQFEPQAVGKLQWKSNGGRLAEFQRKWERIITEWSLRWGESVRGWWFDGCYRADEMYRHTDAPNFQSFFNAARAGNPNSIVAINPGVKYPIRYIDQSEDYTAGEINEPQEVDSPGRWLGGVQFHMLSFLGRFWGVGAPRFNGDEVIEFTRSITDFGGVVSWDVPVHTDGTLDPAFVPQLRAIGKAVASVPISAEPPPVRAKLTVDIARPPMAKPGNDSDGELIIRATNPSLLSIEAQAKIWVEPPNYAVLSKSNVVFQLNSHATAPEVLAVSLTPQAKGAALSLCIQRHNDPRVLRYPLPVRQELTLMHLPAMPATHIRFALGDTKPHIIKIDGQKLAKIRLAKVGPDIAIAADVVDCRMVLTPLIWDGSCIEVFGASPTTRKISQYFLTPSIGDQAAKARQVTRDGRIALLDVPVTTARKKNGYELTALIPITFLGAASPRDPFLFELSITGSQAGDAFQRATLFGSRNAAGDCGAYAKIDVVSK